MLARALGLLLLAGLVPARPADAAEARKPAAEMSAQEIEACVQDNFPNDSMKQIMKMVMKDRMGVERLLEAEMFWEKEAETGFSKVLLKFDNPPELRGSAVLVLEKKPVNDMVMFLPELGKTRRITSSMVNGNMMGTDFTYEDFSRLQGMIGSLEAYLHLAAPTGSVPDSGSEVDSPAPGLSTSPAPEMERSEGDTASVESSAAKGEAS